ncbi:MAG: hypothetical protein A3A65_02890 [Candidatus Chisholmbacteria bacterium RIFCSPLOWO2_01_FULL_49_14]|uniref:Peptidase M28 domain-containing protein n=1 Tax=Candidatus Chisholmbacteria bacterium RIFCSPLOWO2_01_FULL_49_14 TaxID=1797593 RepID=A0A1G1W3K1_9BACT|nr:MAG: hypothetical protein A3A65_02890 [Candidatus Chisholmbacteria bacterium RIFCSPLOWO2_01_FULL_49_14]
MEIKKLIEESYLLRRAYVSDDVVRALDNLKKYSNVKSRDFLFPSGKEYNGWMVPKKWDVKEAKILRNGRIVYDGLKHPLGVITNSSSFVGKVSKKKLVEHLHFAPNRPDAIPYHFRLQYRPWESDWGFCVPKTLYNSLKPGTYEVVLKTTLIKGVMVSREFILAGKSKYTIIFVAHVDHPGQANDDLTGCAVGIALLNELAKRYRKPRYTYKLLLTQEILGSVFYLHTMKKQELTALTYGLFLEMLGNKNTLHLQKSLLGDTYIDRVAMLALRKFRNPRISDFRESAGNDEIVFEAPGIEIPMPSISRWPYPEYHTSDDNLKIIHESKLQESVKYLLEMVFILEHDWVLTRIFDGLVSLANPKYDLYVDPGQIIGGGLHKNKALEGFQYQMPRYLTGKYAISDLAAIFEIDFGWLVDYFKNMEKKKLVSLSGI